MRPLRLPFILKEFVALLDWLGQSVLLLGFMRQNEGISFTFVVFQNGKVTYPIPDKFRTEIEAKIPFLWVIFRLRQRPIVHFRAICSRSPVICLSSAIYRHVDAMRADHEISIKFINYGKPDYQASEMVIGETQRVMGIKDDAWGMVQGLRTSNTIDNSR